MKKYKNILPIIMIAVFIGSVCYLISERQSTIKEYDELLEKARAYSEQGVIIDAEDMYSQAIEIQPSLELSLELGNAYIMNEALAEAAIYAKKILIPKYPKDVESYFYGITVYLKQENYRKVFSCYEDCVERGLANEEIESLMASVKYRYDLTGNFDDVGEFSNTSTLVAVKDEDLWGYADTSGLSAIDYQYLEAGLFANDLAAVVDEEGIPFFIDANGNTKIVATYFKNENKEDLPIESFSSIQNNIIMAFYNEHYHYFDANTYKPILGEYTLATVFSNGVAGVSDSGDKWRLISEDGNDITDNIYDEVIADGKGIICRSDAVIVRDDKGYRLITIDGENVNEIVYEDAKAFYDGTLAAVKKEGKWIFVNAKGEESNFGEFADAESFSNGLAAVKIGDTWGYIDMSGELVIENSFADATAFSNVGSCFVKETEESRWKMLRLLSKMY